MTKQKKSNRWKYTYNEEGILCYRQHRKRKELGQYLLTTGTWRHGDKMKPDEVSMYVYTDNDPFGYRWSDLTTAEQTTIKMKELLLKG